MFRKISAATLALAFLSAPALAMDCEQEFRVRIDRMMAKPDIRVPISDMVSSTRFILQGFDACMKGDMTSAKSFFEQSQRRGS